MENKEINSILKNLISFKTTENNIDEFEKVFEYIKNLLPNYYIKEYEFNKKKSLVISNYNTNKFDLIFCTHVDIVPTNEENMGLKEDQQNIYGRGSIDMKGQLAVIISLLKNNLFKNKICLFITSDEEIDGNCVKQLVELYKTKVAIVPDGGMNFDLIEEEKGLLQLKIFSKTKSSHASTPYLGKNAILELINLYNKIIEKYPNPENENQYKTSINLSILNGGDSNNKVPDNAFMILDMRYTSETKPSDIIEYIKSINKEFIIEIITEGPLFKTDVNNKLINEYIKSSEKILNKKINIKSISSTSDAIYFSQKEIPTIIMNPIGENPHAPNEYVNKESLNNLYEIYFDYLKKLELEKN